MKTKTMIVIVMTVLVTMIVGLPVQINAADALFLNQRMFVSKDVAKTAKAKDQSTDKIDIRTDTVEELFQEKDSYYYGDDEQLDVGKTLLDKKIVRCEEALIQFLEDDQLTENVCDCSGVCSGIQKKPYRNELNELTEAQCMMIKITCPALK